MRTLTNNFRTGTVTAVTRDYNVPAYDVQLNEGNIYKGVPISMQGESLFPVNVGDVVHLIFPRGAFDLPYIIGKEATKITEKTENRDENAEYEPDQNDLVLRHSNQQLSLSESGVTVDSTITRIQLSTKLRISKNGESANQILNADPFVNELYSYITQLETSINALNQIINVISPTLTQAQQTLIAPLLATSNGLTSSSASKSRAQATVNTAISIP